MCTFRDTRMQLGLSLREVARRAEMEPAHLSRVERGLAKPSVASLVRLARVLDLRVSLDELDSVLPPSGQSTEGDGDGID